MDQKVLNKTITIQGVTIKETKSGQKYSLKDHEGRTFNFFTTKQDGDDTSAFAQFKTMGLGVGSTVMIGYVEEEFEMQGKTVLSKKIINFRETNEVPTLPSQTEKSSNLGHSVSSQGHSDKDDAFWDKKAYKQCLWNYWLQSKTGIELEDSWANEVWKVFNEIEQDANKRFSPLRQAVQKHAPQVVEELPTIQIEDEVNVEDIPF